ncbi:MAG: hypothetical protein GWN01_00595 [Nitrosopumilaceae archaeon]|nr:hypothetical protein [Nitrosopumilaceae archaeon]NIT99479.1 hypothetical protein [Nitrosopumilaceae archaeon]NIU85838.1 hypothetical protein [Nitrosopumilaceae archaeon]NIV64695.1 hypothetical protein [Nitrosopumilaceae archaeon]NIX60082.1 hypothetical protein [Nitrosopumilaceae archaeon]
MTSKKGVAVTIGILVAITLASFIVWFIPSTNQSIPISDYKNNLDGIKNIHQAIKESVNEDFQRMLDNEISPDEFNERAKVASSQINSQIIKIMQSNPPEEWKKSYQSYQKALRTFNSYIRETQAVSSAVQDEESGNIEKNLEKLNQLKEESRELVKKSDSSRP